MEIGSLQRQPSENSDWGPYQNGQLGSSHTRRGGTTEIHLQKVTMGPEWQVYKPKYGKNFRVAMSPAPNAPAAVSSTQTTSPGPCLGTTLAASFRRISSTGGQEAGEAGPEEPSLKVSAPSAPWRIKAPCEPEGETQAPLSGTGWSAAQSQPGPPRNTTFRGFLLPRGSSQLCPAPSPPSWGSWRWRTRCWDLSTQFKLRMPFPFSF